MTDENLKARTIAVADELKAALMDDDNDRAVTALFNLQNFVMLDPKNDLALEIGRLTKEIYDGLNSIYQDPKIAEISESELMKARDRLEYVVEKTEESANTTMDIIERCSPMLKQLSSNADQLIDATRKMQHADSGDSEDLKKYRQDIAHFLMTSKANFTEIDMALMDVMTAQSFQDLTGQAVKRVLTLMEKIETSVRGIIRIVHKLKMRAPDEVNKAEKEDKTQGPVLASAPANEFAQSQSDIDDLFNDLNL